MLTNIGLRVIHDLDKKSKPNYTRWGEFVIPIQYLNDEQMYKLVAYMNKIIEIL